MLSNNPVQEAQPHKAEAVAVTGTPVTPTLLSEDITLDDLAASLRMEHAEVATALLKTRDCLQEQTRQQQRRADPARVRARSAAAGGRTEP